MKKLLTAMILVMGFASVGVGETLSDRRQLAWLCNLSFDATAQGVQVIIGHFEMAGRGTLRCVAPTGEKKRIPVNVDFVTQPVALKVAIGVMQVHGEALQISLLAKNPEDVLGMYFVGGPTVAVGVGVGVFAATHANFPSITLNVGLQLVAGLGFSVGIDAMNLSAR